jgi:hypothetical protein
MKTYQWQEHSIEVRAIPLPKYLYLNCAIEVTVGGQTFLPKNLQEVGVFQSLTRFKIISSTGSFPGVVRATIGSWIKPILKTTIEIDGEIVAKDILTIENLPLLFSAWLILGFSVGTLSGYLRVMHR